MNLYNIPQNKDWPHIVNAVVEIPRGTSAKYEYNPDYGYFEYDRSLASAMTYPATYGFIPQTKAEDGDALDILIYNSTPISRGTVVECNILGVLDMDDDGEKDYKVIGTPTSHVRDYSCLNDLDPLFLKITKNFFLHYKDLNGKEVAVHEWHDKDFAASIIAGSLSPWKEG